MNANEVKAALTKMSELITEYRKLETAIRESGWFDDLCWMDVTTTYRNCTITDEGLVSETGILLSSNGDCMDEGLPYFVNQSCGYSGDDYSGTMFFKVDDKGTFVAVDYHC